MSEQRKGVVYGLTAYFVWGLFPLYWPLLDPAGSLEILANRVVWSLGFVLVLLALAHRWEWIRPLLHDRRRLVRLSLAAVLIATNWGTYIYGVTNGHVVETSLGYFINPLVTIALGVLVLGERLRRLQWAAVALGALAVVVLTLDYGRLPWIALVLAFSFGSYGLLKKQVGMGPIESLTVETGVLFLPAAGYLAWLQLTGQSSFLGHGPGHAALLMSSGVVTAVPLLAFGAAAIRVPLTWIGLLQYLTPVLQFLFGVALFHESMPASRWVGFALVWVALAAISAESLHSFRHRTAATEVLAAEAH